MSKKAIKTYPRAAEQPTSARDVNLIDEKPIAVEGMADHVGFLVRRAQLWMFQEFSKSFASVDLRPAHYSALMVIAANPGLTQTALADQLGIERPRVVHLLDDLEGQHLVERLPSPNDRRSHALHLTPRGAKDLRKFKVLGEQHERQVAEKLGVENRRELLRILSVFRES